MPESQDQALATSQAVPAPEPKQPQEPPPPKLLQEADQVLELLRDLTRDFNRVRAQEARACRLRVPAYSLLALVHASGREGLTVSEAASRLGVRPQALSTLVAELGQEGLLIRRVDETDGRARRLRATRKGAQRLESAGRVRRRLLREILAQIPSPSVARLVLDRLELALKRA